MLATDFILNELSPLRLDDTVGDAKKIFTESLFSHIPIVENEHFIGLLSETEVPSLDDDKIILKEVQYLFQSFFTNNDTSWLDLLNNFALNDCNILPVLNADKKYVGYFELSDVMLYFSRIPFFKSDNTTIIVSKHTNDFAISEIAQIIESNNATLYGVFISNKTKDRTELTIKLYSDNINDVIHTFRRYNYTIVKGINKDEYLDDLKERSDYFQKYLNI